MHSYSAGCFTTFVTVSQSSHSYLRDLKSTQLHQMLQELSPGLTIWSASVRRSFAILISNLKELELRNYQQSHDISPSALKQKENYPWNEPVAGFTHLIFYKYLPIHLHYICQWTVRPLPVPVSISKCITTNCLSFLQNGALFPWGK